MKFRHLGSNFDFTPRTVILLGGHIISLDFQFLVYKVGWVMHTCQSDWQVLVCLGCYNKIP